MIDITKYIDLLTRVYQLQDKLRNDPPNDPGEYAALISDIKSLYEEISALLKGGEITAADIRAAHARNQTVWPDPRPPADAKLYGVEFDAPIPSKDSLLGGGYVTTDLVYANGDRSKWLVMKRGEMAPANFTLYMRLDR